MREYDEWAFATVVWLMIRMPMWWYRSWTHHMRYSAMVIEIRCLQVYQSSKHRYPSRPERAIDVLWGFTSLSLDMLSPNLVVAAKRSRDSKCSLRVMRSLSFLKIIISSVHVQVRVGNNSDRYARSLKIENNTQYTDRPSLWDLAKLVQIAWS